MITVAPEVCKAAAREDDASPKVMLVTTRFPSNQSIIIESHARSLGIDKSVLVRRIVREWILVHFSR